MELDGAEMKALTQCLSDAELGLLMRAMFAYESDGTEPELDGRTMMFWPILQMKIDSKPRKLTRSEVGKKAALARWNRSDATHATHATHATQCNAYDAMQRMQRNATHKRMEEEVAESVEKQGIDAIDATHECIDADEPLETSIYNNNSIIYNSSNNNNSSMLVEGYNDSNLYSNSNLVSYPIRLPLKDGTEYEVTQADADHLSALYPDVDVLQELRNMLGWCEGNKAKLKTRSGIKRFINSWLSKTQACGGKNTYVPQPKQSQSGTTNVFLEILRGLEDGTIDGF